MLRRSCLALLGGLILCAAASAAEGGKGVAEKRGAKKPWADLPLPQLGVRQLDNTPLRRTETFVWVRMPQVEGYSNVFDLQCYEEPRDFEFLGHRVLEGGVLELRHRSGSQPHLVIVTELTPGPGKVQIVARPELDPQKGAGKEIPEDLPLLNMCPTLVRARGSFILYDSYPQPFPEIIDRCFIFTDRGRTFLKDTVRRKMPRAADDDPRNNPPWIQVYRPVWWPVQKPSTGNTWYNTSTDRFTIPLIGVVSLDGKHLIALANDTSESLCQAWGPCLHNNPKWAPEDAPPAERRWRVNVYIMPNDPDMLLERVAEDFPAAFKLQEKRVPPEAQWLRSRPRFGNP